MRDSKKEIEYHINRILSKTEEQKLQDLINFWEFEGEFIHYSDEELDEVNKKAGKEYTMIGINHIISINQWLKL